MVDPTVKVANKWVAIISYPMLAILVVHVGNENSFEELLQIPSYYTDLLLALGCSCAVGWYIDKLVRWMDAEITWSAAFKKRLVAQLLLGVALPTLISVGIEVIYLSFLDIIIKDSSIFYLELPLIFMLCLIINLIQLVRYQNSFASEFQKSTTIESDEKEHKRYFAVQAGKGFLNIPVDEVAYFKIQNKLTFLITQDGQSYIYDFPFKEIMESLPPEAFFQLNRQVIARRNSILKSHPTKTRRLEIKLSPSLDERVFVAKTKASGFLDWLQSA